MRRPPTPAPVPAPAVATTANILGVIADQTGLRRDGARVEAEALNGATFANGMTTIETISSPPSTYLIQGAPVGATIRISVSVDGMVAVRTIVITAPVDGVSARTDFGGFSAPEFAVKPVVSP